MFEIKTGNLFDNIEPLGIDGIFAPVYSHRYILVNEYKNMPYHSEHYFEYNYHRDLSKKECKEIYTSMLNALVKVGAKRLATYSLHLGDGHFIPGREKMIYIQEVLEEWYERHKNKIEALYLFDF